MAYTTYPNKKHCKQYGSETIGSLPAESREVHDKPCSGAKGGGQEQVSCTYPKKAAHKAFKSGLPA